MTSPAEIYERLPISIRRTVALRPQRRWLRARAYRRWHNARVGGDAPTVNFFPMLPEPRMQVSWLMRAARIRIGIGAHGSAPTFAWDTGTWFKRGAAVQLPPSAINGRCLDVSKSRVDAVWAEVAGYSIRVDPARHDGPLILKSEINGAHDGRLLAGPLSPRTGRVYQRFVDTRADGYVHSTRPMIVNGDIPIVLQFWRVESDLFHGVNNVAARSTAEMYSPREREQLLEFADRIGLDFGELDVFRDRRSELIYVLDANRTSFRPTRLTPSDFRRCYRALVPAFRRMVELAPTGRSWRG